MYNIIQKLHTIQHTFKDPFLFRLLNLGLRGLTNEVLGKLLSKMGVYHRLWMYL